MDYKQLAEKAEQTEDPKIINWVRKIMLNDNIDPNQYFSEQRKTLTGDKVVTKINVNGYN